MADVNEQYFFAWDGVAEKWITSEETFDQDYPSKPQGEGDSVAKWVIEDVFGLDLDSTADDYGSYLPGYDIQNRDAYQMVSLSLAAELINGNLVECYTNGDGTVGFHLIGKRSSDAENHVLYKINSGELRNSCDNVMVIGYDPPPKRYSGVEFNLFTFARYAEQYKLYTYTDPDLYSYPRRYSWGKILGPQACHYYKEGYIEYGDPKFDQESALIQAGVFDPKKYENVNNYVYKVEVPFFEQGSTEVKFQASTPRFVELVDAGGSPSFGKLQKRLYRSSQTYTSSYCMDYSEVDADTGIDLPESDSPKFIGVKDVIIYGYELKSIYVDEQPDGEKGVTAGLATFGVQVDTMALEPFKLSRGEDYIVIKREGNTKFTIVFSCNVDDEYKKYFGESVATNQLMSFRVALSSILSASESNIVVPACHSDYGELGIDINCTGLLRDGFTSVSNKSLYNKIIFPMGNGQTGYVVEKVYVVYEWDNPCIYIKDENNKCTPENLEDVQVSFYPIIIRDERAPTALCKGGSAELLDPSEIIPDLDADTVQDIAGTTYARAFSELESGDIKITLPFAEADDCLNISNYIYELQNDVVEQTTYTCSPDAEPILGELMEGKTINSIDYSYQDSSQYLISVQAGPAWQGITGWEDSVYNNQTERLQLEGIVTDLFEDQVTCYVQLEQIGMLQCINGSKELLQKGDRVSVTVFNNPVSI